MKLLIVESPNKTTKLKGYLGQGWEVAASYGHIRDLPVKEIGVEGPEYWPSYVTGERSGPTIAKLKKLAQQADEIYLATDPDREGEAIAWHLEQLLCKNKAHKRVTFNEITKTAVQKALANPRQVDKRLFLAQQGRRVLDRLFGYKVSPVLGNKLGQRGLSAGRVQSVALRLVVEREQAIRAFVKTDHFGVRLDFPYTDSDGVSDGSIWSAKWLTEAYVSDDNPYVTDRAIAVAIAAAAERGVKVIKFEEKEQARKPPAPLITSTLQQAAANKLKMSVDTTMKAAQKLFEEGLITYHRTDNPNLSEDGIQAVWEFLRSVGQQGHIPEQPHRWKAKGDAQEAHEAIRPTDFHKRKSETGDEKVDQLYLLIWRTAVACQMRSAVYKVRTALFETIHPPVFDNPVLEGKTAQFNASGRVLVYPGWTVLMNDDYTNEDADENQTLPLLVQGSQQIPQATEILALETKPPRRYSEVSLVKALEREGIGRPSTYASIISVITKRDYVRLEKRLFVPTELGEAIVNALKGHFSFMEVAYTREMEDGLDAIAQGSAIYQSVVAQYDQALDEQLAVFSADTSITAIAQSDTPSYHCPQCGTGVLRRIKGKNGYFWGCSNYQNNCKYTAPDAKGKPGTPKLAEPKSTEHPCPACGQGYMQRRAGKKKGTFWWGCDSYPDCKHTEPDVNGKPKFKE